MLRLFALALEGDIGGVEAPFPFSCGLLMPVAIGAMVAVNDEDVDDVGEVIIYKGGVGLKVRELLFSR